MISTARMAIDHYPNTINRPPLHLQMRERERSRVLFVWKAIGDQPLWQLRYGARLVLHAAAMGVEHGRAIRASAETVRSATEQALILCDRLGLESVAAIQGYAETLLRGRADPATAAGFLEVVHRQAQRMGRLVEDLLTLSEIEARPPDQAVRERVPLAEAAAHVLATVRERAEGDVPPSDLLRIDTCWSVATTLSLIDIVRAQEFQARRHEALDELQALSQDLDMGY